MGLSRPGRLKKKNRMRLNHAGQAYEDTHGDSVEGGGTSALARRWEIAGINAARCLTRHETQNVIRRCECSGSNEKNKEEHLNSHPYSRLMTLGAYSPCEAAIKRETTVMSATILLIRYSALVY